MAPAIKRKNQQLLGWLKASGVAAATYAGLLGMQFSPGWGAAAVALAAGALALVATDLGILAAILGLSVPVLAADAVAGVVFVVLGVIGIRYLGAEGGKVFFVVAAAIAGALLGPAWAAAALAGFIMGAGEGALAAAVACLAIEALGIALGKPAIGAVVTGGQPNAVLLNFADGPGTLFSTSWLAESFGNLGTPAVNRVVDTFAAASGTIALFIQPAVWALAAAVAGLVGRSLRAAGRPVRAVAGVAAGVAVAGVGTAAATSAAGSGSTAGALALAFASSLFVAVAFAWLFERSFPFQALQAPADQPQPATMAAEDADVDELLHLIATAEDRLTTHHTTVRTVMITDMKSFSRITEEDGSMLTAKAIQRHRDLLLPIIQRHGGHGKSTGGDGLVASFDAAADALVAACEMQSALREYNGSHPGHRELTVRIGIALGEVVLDKGGRPFIGTALNLAARIMNLADGGQALATASVVAKGGSVVRTFSHGAFELKNIAEPVEVVELLYSQDQEPLDPRQRLSA